MNATDWKVLYGYKFQFKAYFDDRALAEKFAATHHGLIVPLAQLDEPDARQVAMLGQLDALRG